MYSEDVRASGNKSFMKSIIYTSRENQKGGSWDKRGVCNPQTKGCRSFKGKAEGGWLNSNNSIMSVNLQQVSNRMIRH